MGMNHSTKIQKLLLCLIPFLLFTSSCKQSVHAYRSSKFSVTFPGDFEVRQWTVFIVTPIIINAVACWESSRSLSGAKFSSAKKPSTSHVADVVDLSSSRKISR